MGFLDNLGTTLTEKGKVVADKAKEMADVTRLKVQISSEESKIKEAYLQIGRLFCNRDMGEVPEEFIPYVQIVANSKAQIENLKGQISDVKGIKICPECGAENPLDATFCSACGSKVESTVKTEAASQTEAQD